MPEIDVPSPIDFHDPAQARAWEADTIARRPWRPQFFAAFAQSLNQDFTHPFTVLELGSGPGRLAAHLLDHCRIDRYAALDFSPAMHDIARDRLSAFADRTEFVVRDFRDSDWGEGLGPFDAVVTMQAAHETRHKRHLPSLLCQARARLKSGGLLLFCDHYAGEGKHSELYLSRQDQPEALRQAGFAEIVPCLDMGGMALFSARN